MAAQNILRLNTPPRSCTKFAPPFRKCCSCLSKTCTVVLNMIAFAILGDEHKLGQFGLRSHGVGFCCLLR
eukprot:3126477-Amphidinium_carterae.1